MNYWCQIKQKKWIWFLLDCNENEISFTSVNQIFLLWHNRYFHEFWKRCTHKMLTVLTVMYFHKIWFGVDSAAIPFQTGKRKAWIFFKHIDCHDSLYLELANSEWLRSESFEKSESSPKFCHFLNTFLSFQVLFRQADDNLYFSAYIHVIFWCSIVS